MTHKPKVELKLKPQSLLWSGVKPRAILEMQGTEEGLETVVRVGARYDTVNGLWAEVEFALSEDHAIRQRELR